MQILKSSGLYERSYCFLVHCMVKMETLVPVNIRAARKIQGERKRRKTETDEKCVSGARK